MPCAMFTTKFDELRKEDPNTGKSKLETEYQVRNLRMVCNYYSFIDQWYVITMHILISGMQLLFIY